MRFFVWSLLCAGLFAVVGIVSFISIPDDDSEFVKHVVLVPSSGEYDSIALSAFGVVPAGLDLASAANVSITLRKDGNDSRATAFLKNIDEKKGILAVHSETKSETWGDAFEPSTYHKWLDSIGLDLSSPSLIAEANVLPKVIADVARYPGNGVSVNPALFEVLFIETTYQWMLMLRSNWVWLHEAFWTGFICCWLTGLCFLAFNRTPRDGCSSADEAA